MIPQPASRRHRPARALAASGLAFSLLALAATACSNDPSDAVPPEQTGLDEPVTSAPVTTFGESLAAAITDPLVYGPLALSVSGVSQAAQHPDGTDQPVVLVELSAENRHDFEYDLAVDALFLVDGGGARTTAEELWDGASGTRRLSVPASATITGSLVFEVDEPVDDLGGWSLLAQEPGAVPASLPLDGPAEPAASDYPVIIDVSQEGPRRAVDEIEIPDNLDDGCVVEYDVNLQEVTIGLDSPDFSSRVQPGTRYVTVLVDTTNVTDAESRCGSLSGYLRKLPISLDVDGLTVAPVASPVPSGRLGLHETASHHVLFEIPTATSTLAVLIGDTTTRIDLGDIALPALAGE